MRARLAPGTPVGRRLVLLAVLAALALPSGLLPPSGRAPGAPLSVLSEVQTPPGPPPVLGPAPSPPATRAPGVVGASHIDPNYAGTYDEPAPMGVTDFGVTSALVPYSYSATAWRGTANFSALKTSGGGVTVMSFQLNVVLVFDAGGQNFSYWVQNVVRIDTSTESIGFVNNIWNFSSPTAALTSAELAGNGSVTNGGGFSYYAYTDSASQPGNGIHLTLPTTVQAEVTTAFHGGTPRVNFLYDDGLGWIAYDNVSFRHASQWTDDGFVVDGHRSAPIASYLYTDAEWDFTGAGADYTDTRSNLTMSLEFWNGHNFEYTPSAWNFGGDTGETIGNVLPSFQPDNASGALAADEENGSGGSLGILYDPSQVARVTFQVPSAASGDIQVGTRNYSYQGNAAVLTLAPGSYLVRLWSAEHAIGSAGWVNVTGGEAAAFELPIVVQYRTLSFDWSGLPNGTSVGISVGAVHHESRSGPIAFTVPDGTVPYRVDPVPGYDLPSLNGTANVSGSDRIVVLAWSAFTYPVSFGEVGLPSGTRWSVEAFGQASASASAPIGIDLNLPNGSWSYNVSSLPWWSATSPNGTVWVNGSSAEVRVAFGRAASELEGVVTPATAQVTVDGTRPLVVGPDGSFRAVIPPGPHVLFAAASGYDSASRNIVTTAGNVTGPIVLSLNRSAPGPAPHPIALGPGGISWAVWQYLGFGAVVAGGVAVLAIAIARRRHHRR